MTSSVLLKARRRTPLPSVLTEDGFVRQVLREARLIKRAVGGSLRTKELRRRLFASTLIDWRGQSQLEIGKAVTATANLIEGLPTAFAPGVRVILDTEANRIVDEAHTTLGKRHKAFGVDPVFAVKNERAIAAINDTTSIAFGPEYEAQAERFRRRAQDTIAAGLSEGLGNREIGQRLRAEFAETAIHPSYWDTVAAIHVNRTRSFSAAATYAENGISEFEVVAILDERTTKICEMMDGTVLSVESTLDKFDELEDRVEDVNDLKAVMPFMRSTKGGEIVVPGRRALGPIATPKEGGGFEKVSPEKMNAAGINMPPYHYRCYPGSTVVQGRVLIALRSFYSGEMVEITTKGRRRITLTANHPVLTPQGFVAASALDDGGDLLCYSGEVDGSPIGSPDQFDEQHEPTEVEEVFGTLAKRGGVLRIDTVADDLHGDARSGLGKVDVVSADRKLLLKIQAEAIQFGRQAVFVESPSASSPFVAVEGSGSGGDFFVGGNPTSRGVPGSTALAPNAVAEVGARATLIPFQNLSLGPASKVDTFLAKDSLDGVLGDAVLASDLLRGQPGEIVVDQVLSIRRFPAGGHVYDLQTATGWAVADGAIVSNCRTTVVPNLSSALPLPKPKRVTAADTAPAPPVVPPTPTAPATTLTPSNPGLDPVAAARGPDAKRTAVVKQVRDGLGLPPGTLHKGRGAIAADSFFNASDAIATKQRSDLNVALADEFRAIGKAVVESDPGLKKAWNDALAKRGANDVQEFILREDAIDSLVKKARRLGIDALPPAERAASREAFLDAVEAKSRNGKRRRLGRANQFIFEEKKGKGANLGRKAKKEIRKWAGDAFDAWGPVAEEAMARHLRVLKMNKKVRVHNLEVLEYFGATNREDFVHELAHSIENHANIPRAPRTLGPGGSRNEDARAKDSFWAQRVQSRDKAPARRLSDITGDRGYGLDEVSKKDKWASSYMGKIYSDGSTEVVSMMTEAFGGHEGLWRIQFSEDPDALLEFIGYMKATIDGEITRRAR